jgi:hypothetical protein
MCICVYYLSYFPTLYYWSILLILLIILIYTPTYYTTYVYDIRRMCTGRWCMGVSTCILLMLPRYVLGCVGCVGCVGWGTRECNDRLTLYPLYLHNNMSYIHHIPMSYVIHPTPSIIHPTPYPLRATASCAFSTRASPWPRSWKTQVRETICMKLYICIYVRNYTYCTYCTYYTYYYRSWKTQVHTFIYIYIYVIIVIVAYT